MPVLVVQQGHCFRTTGATGTVGEQEYAVKVAGACVRLLGGKAGWVVRKILADEGDYRGDAFVAIHCDGSVDPAAQGASVGYRTPEGQAFAQAWKRAYQARGWTRGFRADNHTEALAQYYGVRNAVGKGNRRAFIAECGFRTNRDDRALLDEPGGPERVALAIGEALGIPVPGVQTPRRKAEDMTLRLVRGNSTQQVPGKTFRFGDLRFYVEQDPRLPKKAQRWYTRDTPAQRILEKSQGGVDVVEQKDLDAIPFGPGGEIPPDVLG
jgi:hypothetical protein